MLLMLQTLNYHTHVSTPIIGICASLPTAVPLIVFAAEVCTQNWQMSFSFPPDIFQTPLTMPMLVL